MVNLLITVVGLLSCVSPTLDEASRSRLQCHSIFILVSCHRGHGEGALEGTEEWSRGGSNFYNITNTLAESAQTIYFGFDAMDYLQGVEQE